MTDKTCQERIAAEWENTKKTLESILYRGELDGDTDASLADYGLSFDYVTPGTFSDQTEGYFRYQLSWGGPSDEIRFYTPHPNKRPHKVEYWFMDWFDGTCLDVSGTVADDVYEWFRDVDALSVAFNEAMDDEE